MGQAGVLLGRGQRGDETQPPPACAGAAKHVPRRRRLSVSLESLGGDETMFGVVNIYTNRSSAFSITRDEKA